MHHKTFSIVIPAYNAANTIGKSIHSALAQTHLPIEIIVVEDSSTDNTIAVVQEIIAKNQSNTAIKLIQQPYNQGPANARNIGWDESKGEYICFLDSDDTFSVDKLAFLNEYWPKEAAVVVNKFSHDLLNNDSYHHAFSKITALSIIKSNPAQGSSISVRKSYAHRFPTDQYFAEDLEFALIATQNATIVKTDAILTITSRPQLSAGGLSSNHWNMRKGELRAFTSLSKNGNQWTLALPFLYGWSILKHLIKKIL